MDEEKKENVNVDDTIANQAEENEVKTANDAFSSESNDNLKAEKQEEIKTEDVKEKEVIKEENNEKITKAVEVKEEVTKEDSTEEEKFENQKFETISNNKSKSNSVIIALGIATILIIASAVIAVIYFGVLNIKADKAFKKVIDDVRKEIASNGKNTILDNFFVDLETSVNLKIDDSQSSTNYNDLINLINSLKLKIDMTSDTNKKISQVNIELKKDNASFITLKTYKENNKLYAKLENIYDKYIEVDASKFLDSQYANLEVGSSSIVVADKILEAFENSLKEEYFTESNKDGKKVFTLSLNDKILKEISKNMLTKLKDDNEFLISLSKMTKETSASIKANLEESLADIDSGKILDEDVIIEISAYVSSKLDEVIFSVKKANTVVNSLEVKTISEKQISFEYSTSTEKIIGSIINKKEVNVDNVILNVKYGTMVDATINFAYSITENSKIEVQDVSNAVNVNDLTMKEIQGILEKIQKNETIAEITKVIEDSFKSKNTYGIYSEFNISDDEDTNIIDENEKESNTLIKENMIEGLGYTVEFKIPNGYVLDEKYSSNSYKYFDDAKNDTEVYLNITYDTAKEYFEDVKKYDYEYKINDDGDFYSNVELSDIKELKVGRNGVLKYQKLTYNAGTSSKYEEIFGVYELDNEKVYTVEIEARNHTIPESLLSSFADITIKK